MFQLVQRFPSVQVLGLGGCDIISDPQSFQLLFHSLSARPALTNVELSLPVDAIQPSQDEDPSTQSLACPSHPDQRTSPHPATDDAEGGELNVDRLSPELVLLMSEIEQALDEFVMDEVTSLFNPHTHTHKHDIFRSRPLTLFGTGSKYIQLPVPVEW